MDYYVDLNSEGGEGTDGSIGNPWGPNEFAADLLVDRPSEDTTYFIKGKFQYPEPESNYVFGIGLRNSVTWDKWEATPPTISMVLGDDKLGIRSLVGPPYTTKFPDTLTIKNCIMDAIGTGDNRHLFSFKSSAGDEFTRNVLLENCIFSMSNGGYGSRFIEVAQDELGVYNISIKGCSFISPWQEGGEGSPIIDIAIKNVRTSLIDIDSCYFDGSMQNYFSVENESVTNYKYCGFYNNYRGFNSDGTAGPGNQISTESPSQLADVNKSAMDYTLPDDVTPIEESLLIGAADPALGLATDMFGTTRGSPDTIGSVSVYAAPPTPPTPAATRGRIFGTGRTISLSHNTLYDRSKG